MTAGSDLRDFDVARTRKPTQARFSRPFDVSALLSMFQRHLGLFVAVVAVITVASLVLTLRLTPIYSSTAEIKIDPTQPRAISPDTPSSDTPDQALVDTEVAVIRSRAVAQSVVNQLNLGQDPEFSTPSVGLISRLLGQKPQRQTPDEAAATAVGEVQSRLQIRREFGTYVVDVTFPSLDPNKAAVIANAFARAYIATNLQLRAQGAAEQATWLNQRLAALGTEAESADAQVARYKASRGIATVGADGMTVTDQQIGPLTSQLATAQSDAAAAHSNLDAARAQMSKGGLESVSSVLTSSVIADLRRQRAEVSRNASEIDTRYGPLHPESIKVHQQLDGLDHQIQEEGQRIVSGLQSAAESADARAASLRADLATLKGQQASNESASVQADALQRQADSKREIYKELSQPAQQMRQEEQSQQTRGQIINLAVPGGVPIFPNKRLFAVLGFVTGVIVGSALVLLLEALDTTVRTAEDVEQAFGLNLIASVPALTGEQLRGVKGRRPFDFVVAKPMSGFAEALRTVRSTLTLSGEDGGAVVAITSALPSEGKTTTAASLARVMGMSGERVLLIDCDMRRRSLQDMAGAEVKAGLVDLLNGHVTLDDALQPDKVIGVDLLTLGQAGPTTIDVLGGEEMRTLLVELRRRYSHIVLDAPPVLAVADARTVSALADSVLLIVRWKQTPRKAVRDALVQLEQDGAPILGVVLTQVNMSPRFSFGIGGQSHYQRIRKAYYQD